MHERSVQGYTDLLVDSLVLEMVRCVPPVQPHLVLATPVILHFEPHPALIRLTTVLPMVAVFALHTDTPTAAAPRHPSLTGVAVLSPGHQRRGEVTVSETALSGQLRTVTTMCCV